MPEAAIEPGQWRKVGDCIYSNKRGEMLIALANGGFRYYVAVDSIRVNGENMNEIPYIRNREAEAKIALAEVLLSEAANSASN